MTVPTPSLTASPTARQAGVPSAAEAAAHRMTQSWCDAFNAGDLVRLLATYEPDALLVPAPGAPPVQGLDAIEAALRPFLALGGRMRFTPRFGLVNGDTALGSASYELQGGTDAEGNAVALAGVTSEVIRRQPDGSWKYVVDHPFGGSA